MQRGGQWTIAAFVLLLVFLTGAVTQSGFIPFPGSTVKWLLPVTDSTGCFRSDGSGHVTIVSCVAGSGTGDFSSNTSASVINEVVLFADTTGKLGKRSTGTGVATLTSGQLGTRTAPVGALVGDTDTQVLTNKDIVPVSITYTDATPVAINSDTTRIAVLLSLSQNTLFSNPTAAGTIPNGKSLIIRVKSSSVRTLTWGSEYRGSATFPLPTATSGSGLTDYYPYLRNSADSKWDYFPGPLGL